MPMKNITCKHFLRAYRAYNYSCSEKLKWLILDHVI